MDPFFYAAPALQLMPFPFHKTIMLTTNRTKATNKTPSPSIASTHPILASGAAPIPGAYPEFCWAIPAWAAPMLNTPSSTKELAPGGRINLERMPELLCLNDNGIGCVRAR